MSAPVTGVIALRVVERTHRVVIHEFHEDKRLVIGRSVTATLRIESTGSARLHMAIELLHDDYDAVDNSSANGTLVNGERIVKQRLRVGDIIGIPSCEIEVMALGHPLDEREQAFLDALSDDAARAVYADWLEERGRHGGAAIMRGQVAYPSPPRGKDGY